MKVEIISIGDELLSGNVINTNASWLGEQLTNAGFDICRVTVIPDKTLNIIDAFNQSMANSEAVIVTGGLGPTNDDKTREALCNYFNCNLITDNSALKNITEIFSKRGLAVSEANRKQADVPDKSEVITNEIGTAPGLLFEENNKVMIVMPGVPFEMKQMFSKTVLPILTAKFQPKEIIFKTIHTSGIGESFLSEKLKEWEDGLPGNVSLAYLPRPGIVDLRLKAIGDNTEEINRQLEELILKLQKFIPELIWGYDNDTLESVTGKLLLSKEKTLSTAESCTGGYIAHLITSVPGSSAYFKGSVIAYSNEIKETELGVPADILEKYGAVSKETVCIMARNILNKFSTDYSIAISGVAGPDGGTELKPVGTTWIAVASSQKTIDQHFVFGDNRERNIRRAALSALNMLRKII